MLDVPGQNKDRGPRSAEAGLGAWWLVGKTSAKIVNQDAGCEMQNSHAAVELTGLFLTVISQT